MKMILTSAQTPAEYFDCIAGWQGKYAAALRDVVGEAAPELEERLKWGHVVYFHNGPVLLIRAEPTRVLFGFWRGKQLRHIEPRLRGGGKYEMATLELTETTLFERSVALALAKEAKELNTRLGDATTKAVAPGAA
jgi:hypothetical protein